MSTGDAGNRIPNQLKIDSISLKVAIGVFLAVISAHTIGTPERLPDADNLQGSFQPVNGTIKWSGADNSDRSLLYEEVEDRSQQLRQHNGLFWQDTADSKSNITGPIAAAKYCRELVITIDELRINGFRTPTKREISRAKEVKFNYSNGNQQQPPAGSKELLEGHDELETIGVYSAGNRQTDKDEFTRCVSDRPALEHSTIYDIAQFLSENKKDYLKALERAVNIKYGEPIVNARYQSNTISADIISKQTKRIPFSTDELKTLLSKKSNVLAKKNQSADKSITLIGVYNFRDETILELKINKRLQGLNLESINANYAIVDRNSKKLGGTWNRPGSQLGLIHYKKGNIYYDLEKHNKVYFSIPNVTSTKFDLPASFVGNRKTSLKNVSLKELKISERIFSEYEFTAKYNHKVEKQYLAQLQSLLGDAEFSPTINLKVSEGVIAFQSIDEIENHKHNIDKAEFKKASNSIIKLQNFVSRSSNKDLVDQATVKILDMSFNDLDKLNQFLDRYPNTAHRSRALDQALVLSERNIDDLANFIKRKPSISQTNKAHQAIMKLSFNSINMLNSFLTKYPDTTFKKTALNQILKLSSNNINNLNTFAKKYPSTEQTKQALSQILSLSMSSIEKLKLFIKTYPDNALTVKAEKQMALLEDEGETRRLAKIETKNDYVYGEIIGPKTISGARYIRGLIWQDQAINSSDSFHDFNYAKDYCSHLSLLGVEEWRLPSTEDFKKLGTDIDQLAYRTKSSKKYSFYFTETDGCKKDGSSALSTKQCVYGVDMTKRDSAYVAKINKNTPASVRCVLGTDKYNKHQRQIAAEQLKQGDFSGYLNAFNATGNQANIQQAYRLAKSSAEKAQIELALIRHFGITSVFEAVGTLKGNTNEATSNSENSDWHFTSVDSAPKAIVNVMAARKSNSNVPLKRGKFKTKIRVSLELHYRPVDGKSADYTRHFEEFTWVTLDKSNKYTSSAQFDFGELDKRSEGALGASGSDQLRSIIPTISFEDIEMM
ncbi:MAG: hypothetical protein P1U80_07025 [Pseudomonadales bacterium]|nr:hypothetical protein [Pseudomonadales bacterium]